MKLINTTNSHAVLIQSQLESTMLLSWDLLSNTDVVFTQAPKHYEILIQIHRAVREQEIEKFVTSSSRK